MKNKKDGFTIAELLIAIAIFALLAAIAIPAIKEAAQNQAKAADTGTGEGGDSAAGLGLPSDYFPTATGTHWTYEIDVPDIESNPPLIHSVIDWPISDGKGIATETRGLLWTPEGKSKGPFRLELTVAGKVDHQGPLQYPEGYEVRIDRDELNVFNHAVKLFWAVSHSDGYCVTQVITYDPDATPGAPSGGEWGSYGQDPGDSLRITFFGSKPGMSIGISEQHDSVLFIGPEKFNGADSLHFQRIVEAGKESGSDPGDSVLNAPFSEDMWFVKGVGLEHLVQKVNGNVTMTWQLIDQKDPSDAP